MSTKKYKTAVYVGRFQPFHKAHLKTVQIALQLAEKVIIAVGSSHRPRTIKNPWTEDERMNHIWQVLKAEDIDTTRIEMVCNRDYMYNDTKWVGEIYSRALMAGATDDNQTVLIGHFKDDSSYYLKMFPMWDLHPVDNFYNANSTDIRYSLFEEEEGRLKLRKDFRIKEELESIESDIVPEAMKGILYNWVQTPDYTELREEYEYLQNYKKQFEVLPYPPVFVTVDSIVIKSGCVLLIKRKFNPGKGLWALPGGFIDVNEKVVKSAIRELKEETKIAVDRAVLERSIVEDHVFDHPYRSLRGRTITHAHLIDLGIGELPKVKASDDAAGAHWVPLADANRMEDKFFEDHFDMLVAMTSRF